MFSDKKEGEKETPEVQIKILDDPEAKDNLVGFFNLLLTIDKRNNPKLYD